MLLSCAVAADRRAEFSIDGHMAMGLDWKKGMAGDFSNSLPAAQLDVGVHEVVITIRDRGKKYRSAATFQVRAAPSISSTSLRLAMCQAGLDSTLKKKN